MRRERSVTASWLRLAAGLLAWIAVAGQDADARVGGTNKNATQAKISVIIPCGPNDAYIAETLESLAAQPSSPPFEVVVVDASGKGLETRLRSWCKRLQLQFVSAKEGTAASANRNAGVAVSSGALILFVDADDTVSRTYVRAMTDALELHELVCSSVDMASLNHRLSETQPLRTGLITEEMSFRPFAGAGTLGIRRSLFDAMHGWDESLHFYEEADLCWRIQLAGLEPPAVVRDATLHYRLDPTKLGRWRKRMGFGRTQPLLYRRYHNEGMPRESIPDLVRAWSTLVGGLLRPAIGHRIPRGLGFHAAIRLGRLQGSLRHRVFYL